MNNWIAFAVVCGAVGGGALLSSCDRAETEADSDMHVSFERYEASAESVESEPTAQPEEVPEKADEASEIDESKTDKTAKTEITILGVEQDDPEVAESGQSPSARKKKVDIKKKVAKDVSALRQKQRLQALPESLSNIKRIPTNFDIDKLPVQKGQGSKNGQKK